MADFIESFIAIQTLLADINKLKLNNIITDKSIIKETEEFNKYIQEVFNKDILRQNTLRDIKSNFFNDNIDDKLDEINNKFNREYNLILDLQKKFIEVINQMNSIKKTKKKVVKKTKKNKEIKEEAIIDASSYITIQNTASEIGRAHV